jgi:hypothetical protein
MRTILTFTNNSVRYALFPPAERLIIDICRDSAKMSAMPPLHRRRLTNDLCFLYLVLFCLLKTLPSDRM